MGAVLKLHVDHELPERFRAGMRQLASGVSIVTTGSGDGRRGLTATSVCSVSAEPPTLLVCVNRSAEAHDFLTSTKTFCVNVLGTRDQELCERFAAKDGVRGLARFEFGSWVDRRNEPPALSTALASFDCLLEQHFVVSTHSIFIGRVIDARSSEDGEALVYHNRAFQRVVPPTPREARDNGQP